MGHPVKPTVRSFSNDTCSDMSAPLDEIEQQVLSLGAEDRARLAQLLLESLHASLCEIELMWTEEVDRRVAAFDCGELSAHSAEEVFAEARQMSR
jgi:putative addiction module component (TIGR02574 family)